MTFLFTDIEDSTRLWEEAPTDMADALRVHDAIVRGTIERHGGYVFGTGGDGFCAAFSTAADAAAAAIESQEQLRDDAVVNFAVRMGLHTGEAIERDRNYFGSEVNRAARLMSLAHGGQVLVSDATEVLLRNRVALRPLGEHRLRGLRGRMSVYQVVADGLPTEFPVLRSVDYFAGNLPQQLSSLVGREKVVAEVAELVRSSRLVTLTGVGGVGKTRLALEVGAEVAGEFPDGVWMVELASVGDPASVPAAIATVLGITPQGDAALIDTVADALGGRRLLLVVDNCEHVLAAAGSAIAAILGRSGNVKILATSRETLAVDGETVLTVAPLALDGGVTSDAVTLFVDRARAVRPDFGLREPETATAVTEICETLDGLPLGIELAAARMAAMSAVEVRDRLADRFRLLKGSTPGPERQLTLRHAVEWSYDLLTDDERDLLRLTSVFAGGFDLTSICAVVDGADDVDVLRHLDSLVRKSLVVADHTATRTRYSLFETIRQFAEDRLAETGALERTRDRHAEYFAAGGGRSMGALERARVARRGRLGGGGAGQPAFRIPVERGDEASWRWRPTSRRTPRSWASRCSCSRRWPGPRSCSSPQPRPTSAVFPACTRRPVTRASPGGRRRRARTRTERPSWRPTPATTRASPGTRRSSRRWATCTAATSIATSSSPVRWRERYGSDRGYGLASYVDGLQSCGRIEEALALTEESVAAARSLGNPYWISYALWIAGMAFSKADVRRAFAAWDEGVAFVREHRVQFFEGFLARDAARLHTSDGEPEAALVLFADAIAAFQRAGNVPQLIITLASVPALFERLDRLAPAAMLLGALSREPSSFHHVPELGDLGDRVSRTLGKTRAAELTSAGAALDLGDAAVYARQQIDVARRDPSPRARQARPGGLSRREIEVLRLVADGRTAGEIATQLFISSRTAEHHIQNIYTKIGVSSRAAATRWAVQHQVVATSSPADGNARRRIRSGTETHSSSGNG